MIEETLELSAHKPAERIHSAQLSSEPDPSSLKTDYMGLTRCGNQVFAVLRGPKEIERVIEQEWLYTVENRFLRRSVQFERDPASDKAYCSLNYFLNLRPEDAPKNLATNSLELAVFIVRKLEEIKVKGTFVDHNTRCLTTTGKAREPKIDDIPLVGGLHRTSYDGLATFEQRKAFTKERLGLPEGAPQEFVVISRDADCVEDGCSVHFALAGNGERFKFKKSGKILTHRAKTEEEKIISEAVVNCGIFPLENLPGIPNAIAAFDIDSIVHSIPRPIM